MSGDRPNADDIQRLEREREFLAEHCIAIPAGGFTLDGLTAELDRRGWRWRHEPSPNEPGEYAAIVEKEWHPSTSRTVRSVGWTVPVAMAFSLAEAIRIDAELAARGLRGMPEPRR